MSIECTPNDDRLIFSKRMVISDAVDEWLMDKGISSNPTINVVTALDSYGLLDRDACRVFLDNRPR